MAGQPERSAAPAVPRCARTSSACNALGGWPSSRLIALISSDFLLLQRRDLRRRRAHLCGGIGHVEIGGHTARRALLRELQALLRRPQVVARDRNCDCVPRNCM